MKKLHPITIVIVGPTAGGKSDLAIALAQKYNGEIISADSRQVYRGMDIGSGKVTKAEQKLARHHLLDVASPKRTYNVTHFVRDAKKALRDIHKRGKTAIICGGTGFWVQALLENSSFPSVKPNKVLRKKLEKFSVEKLFSMLTKKDPRRARTIDARNKVRLIRALEICAALGTVPPLKKNQESLPVPQAGGIRNQEFLIIGLNPNREILQKNIKARLDKRLRKGMVAEVRTLHEKGISWKRLESLGLEYKYVALFLQDKLSGQEMREKIYFESIHFAKRQITWLRRWEKMGAHIHWIISSKETYKIIEKVI